MHIHFQCPNGHKIKARPDFSGKRARCPSCDTEIFVPVPDLKISGIQARSRHSTQSGANSNPTAASGNTDKECSANRITESGVMRVLGDMSPLPPPPRQAFEAVRTCPRCRRNMSRLASICTHCQLFIGEFSGHAADLGSSDSQSL